MLGIRYYCFGISSVLKKNAQSRISRSRHVIRFSFFLRFYKSSLTNNNMSTKEKSKNPQSDEEEMELGENAPPKKFEPFLELKELASVLNSTNVDVLSQGPKHTRLTAKRYLSL